METVSRFANDLASWYWWVSVVFVGIAINLLSAYLKTPVDNWWSSTSQRRKQRQMTQNEKFDEEVKRIAADPTLLILEVQRARTAELKVFSVMGVVGIDLILFFVLSLQPEKDSTFHSVLSKAVALTVPFMLMYLLRCMSTEERIAKKSNAACRAYERGG